jgi:hypothetical protein
MAVMHEARYPVSIDDHLSGHAAELEQVHFLTVLLEHAGLGVWQPNEGQVVFTPVPLKGFGVFRANHHYFRAPLNKLWIVLAQLRHMLLAERSNKSAVENQDDMRLAPALGQAHRVTPEIGQGEIWGRDVQG